MNRFNELVKGKLSTILQKERDNNVVLVLKGISLEVLNELGLFFPTIIDGNKLSHIKICKNNKIIPRLYSEQNLVLLWEEFIYLIGKLDISSSDKIFRIIEDNSRQYFPNEGNGTLLIFNGGEIEIDDGNVENTIDAKYFPYREFVQNDAKSFILYDESPSGDNVEVVKLFNDSLTLNNVEKVTNLEDVLYCSTQIELDQNFYKIVNEELSPTDIIINYQNQNDFSKTFPLSHITNWILKNLYGIEIRIRSIEFNELKKDENISDGVYDLLQKFWGEDANFRKFECYRNAYVNKDLVEINQGIIVQNIIDQCDKAEQGQSFRDIFITASTGSGKSLLFQLPSFYSSINKQRITIVISPLIALMKDQVQGILDKGFNKVCYINSELSYDERLKIFQNIKSGNIDLVYLSPELIGSLNILEIVGDRKIAMVVVDEAHTVTTWGQEFRVEYWYLGHYLKKIRNEINRFPIITLTATAIFSGKMDMVEDIILYLRLINPEIYLGSIKRKSIDFRIENYEQEVGRGLRDFKRKQVIEFVNQAIGLNKKAIIYFPFAKDIDTVYNLLVATDRNNDCLNNIDTKVFRYFSKMLSQEKNDSYVNFKNIAGSIMLATKAFGMGVDISDIEIIYHIAPSGSVSDYIQEIGRVARADEKRGYAMIQFEPSDLYYSKLLFQISSIKKWQLQIILGKLKKLFNNYTSKKLFISTDDFEFIFRTNNDRNDNIENKVLCAMLMIENDFIKEYGFPVFLARPQKMYAKAYAKIKKGENNIFIDNEFTELIKIEKDWFYVRVSLDRLWKAKYHDKSLYEVKRKYYNTEIILSGSTIFPQLKLTFRNYISINIAITRINNLFNTITELSDDWMSLDFIERHFNINGYGRFSSLLTSFLVNRFSTSYSKRLDRNNEFHIFHLNEDDVTIKYKKYNNGIIKLRDNIISVLNHFNDSFQVCDKSSCDIFISYSEQNLDLIKLCLQLFEILQIGSVEISGGESQVLALYVNDTIRFDKKAASINYENSIAKKQFERHCSSNDFFNYFFTVKIDDNERWNVIEDYFLGKELTYIKQHYVSSRNNSGNLFEGISCNENVNDINARNAIPIFTPVKGQNYLADDRLTFIINNEAITRTIDEWIIFDPLQLHLNLSQIGFRLDLACYNNLKENLRIHHLDYYADNFQNNPLISINGRSMAVSEWIVNRPDEFYASLCENPELKYNACLSSKNKFILFGNVNHTVLLQEDRSWLKCKRETASRENFNNARLEKFAALMKFDSSDDLNKYLKFDFTDFYFVIDQSNNVLVEINVCKFYCGRIVENESRILCRKLCEDIYEKLIFSFPNLNAVNILILLRRDLEFIDQNLRYQSMLTNLNLCGKEEFCNKLFIYLWNNRSIY